MGVRIDDVIEMYLENTTGFPDAWGVLCASTGLALCELCIWPHKLLDEDADWSVRDHASWPNLRMVLADANGVDDHRFDLAIDRAYALRANVAELVSTWELNPNGYDQIDELWALTNGDSDVDIGAITAWVDKRLADHRATSATKLAKRTLSASRRADFGSKRAALVLAMIDAGAQYRCAVPSCHETEDLTVDHIIPLSRGGTDDLWNLQFMCRCHNSTKGDRVFECAHFAHNKPN